MKNSLLYVEDNQSNALLVEKIINSHFRGIETIITNSVEGAVLAVNENFARYGLILSDLRLGADARGGLKVIELLKPVYSAKNFDIKFVAITADLMRGSKKECLDAGYVDFCPKPISIERIVDLVDRYWLGDSYEKVN